MSERPCAHTLELVRQSKCLRASLALLIALGAGCSSFGDETSPNSPSPTDSPGVEDSGAITASDGGPTVEKEAGTITGAPVVTVKGTVVDSNGGPIDKKVVVIVDANGTRHETQTIADGTFSVDNVALPYDVALASTTTSTRAFLDVTRTDVYLTGVETSPTMVENHATVTLPVAFPACTKGSCEMILRTSSPHWTYGRGDLWWSGAAKVESQTVPLVWEVAPADAGASETGDIEVLAFEKDYSTCWYAKATSAFTVTAGASATVGQITPSWIPTLSATIAVDDSKIPPDWARTTSAGLRLPSGNDFELRSTNVATLSNVLLPKVPGATYQTFAYGTKTVTDGDLTVYDARSTSTSPLMPLTNTQVSMTLDAVPSLIAPTVGGTLSRSSQGYAWDAVPNGVSAISVGSATLYTTRHELTFAKLATLGLTPDLGEQGLTLTTGHQKATVDELVDPNPSTRKSLRDTTLDATWQNARYTLTQ